MTTYTNRNDAIQYEIADALHGWMTEFDIDAIADEVLGDYGDGYALQVTEDEFWNIVAKHANI